MSFIQLPQFSILPPELYKHYQHNVNSRHKNNQKADTAQSSEQYAYGLHGPKSKDNIAAKAKLLHSTATAVLEKEIKFFQVYLETFDRGVMSQEHPNSRVKKCYEQMTKVCHLFKQIFGEEFEIGTPLRMRLNAKNLNGYMESTCAWNAQLKCVDIGMCDIRHFAEFEQFLDIVTHEFMHGYFLHKNVLAYDGESGALNESLADAFGAMVRHSDEKKHAAECSWDFAAGLLLDNDRSMPLRSFAKPGSAFKGHPIWKDDLQISHMRYFNPDLDVHTNSGVPNRAFYLAVSQEKGHSYGQIGKIWFAALKQCKLRTGFREFAHLTYIEAGKINLPVQIIVKNAWLEVGVDPLDTSLRRLSRAELIHRTKAAISTKANLYKCDKEPLQLNQRQKLISVSLRAINKSLT